MIGELERRGFKRPELAQLLYTWLHPHSDDFGRLDGSAYWIKFNVFQCVNATEEEIEIMLECMDKVELIQWYTNGKSDEKYIQIIDFEKHQTGLHKRTASKFPDPPQRPAEIPGNSGKFSVEGEGKGKWKKEFSIHAPRPKAATAEELEKMGFVLRTYDDEFPPWTEKILRVIGAENRSRPQNGFTWKPTTKNVQQDLRGLMYGLNDDEKKSILWDAYNILDQRINWPAYLELGIRYMIRASEKTPIHTPFQFMKALLKKPGDIIAAVADGKIAGKLDDVSWDAGNGRK